MFNSITETARVEYVLKSSAPWVWVGFLFAGAFWIFKWPSSSPVT